LAEEIDKVHEGDVQKLTDLVGEEKKVTAAVRVVVTSMEEIKLQLETKIEEQRVAFEAKEAELASAKSVISTCQGSEMKKVILALHERKDELTMKVAEKITAATECKKE
jgi:hypothetical protein